MRSHSFKAARQWNVQWERGMPVYFLIAMLCQTKPQQTQKAEFLRCIYLGSLPSLSSRWQSFLPTASCVFLAYLIKVRPFRSCLNALYLPSSSWLSFTTSHCPQWTNSATCPANSTPHSATEDQRDAFIHATLSKAIHLRSNSLRILSISIIHG